MPQLDKVTFLSQLWWCFFVFLGFYFVIHKSFLPKISRILKLRKKKITMSQDDLSCEVLTKMDGVCPITPAGWWQAAAFPFLLALVNLVCFTMYLLGKALQANFGEA